MKSLGATTPRVGTAPADQRLDAGGHHLVQVEGRLVDEEELASFERSSQVDLELHVALGEVLHAVLEDDAAVLAFPLGSVGGDLGVAQEMLGRGLLADGDPDAGGDQKLVAGLELERLGQGFLKAIGDQQCARSQGVLLDDHHELVSAEAAESVGVADDSVESRRDRPQQLIAGLVAQGVVDGREVVEIHVQSRHGRLVAPGPAEHLVGTVDDQRPVGEARQLVMGRHEGELLLMLGELRVHLLALRLEDLAHPHERHVEGHLGHRQGALADLLGVAPFAGRRAEHLADAVPPSQAALGDLVQRGGPVGGQRSEQLPGFAAGVEAVLRPAAGHPFRHGDRGDPADPPELLADGLVEDVSAGFVCEPQDDGQNVVGPFAQGPPEEADFLARAVLGHGGASGHGHRAHPPVS